MLSSNGLNNLNEWLPSDFIKRDRLYRMCEICLNEESQYDAKQKSDGGRFMFVNFSICNDCYLKIVANYNDNHNNNEQSKRRL